MILNLNFSVGAGLPDTYGSWTLLGGSNPGDLGEYFREISNSSGVTIDKNGGNAPVLNSNSNRHLVFLVLLVSLFLASCNREQVYNGELGFQVVRIGSLVDYKDKNGVVLVEKFDTLTSDVFLDDWEIEFKAHYDDLKKNGVLYYESILLGESKEEYDVVFLPQNEFEKISQFKWGNLGIAKHKVLLSVLGTRIDSNRIKGIEILSVEEVPGSTFYKK